MIAVLASAMPPEMGGLHVTWEGLVVGLCAFGALVGMITKAVVAHRAAGAQVADDIQRQAQHDATLAAKVESKVRAEYDKEAQTTRAIEAANTSIAGVAGQVKELYEAQTLRHQETKESMDARFATLDAALEARFRRHHEKQDGTQAELGRITVELAALRDRVKALEARL